MGTSNRILIVDDDPGFRITLRDILKAKGYEPVDVAKGETALSKIDEVDTTVALIDLKLSDMTGLEVMKEIKKRSPDTECIVLTGFASQDSAIEAINLGAYSYLQKPYNVDQLLLTVQRAVEKRKASEALQESEAKFRNLAEQSPNMIFINKKGQIVYANKQCEEVMGYTREEFYSPDFDFLTLIASEYVDLIKSNFVKHMRGEDVPPYEYALVTKKGKRMDVVLAPKLIHFEGERAILGTVTDITEIKRAEEALRVSEEKFRTVFEFANTAICLVDLRGYITQVNPKMCEMFGYSKDELEGMTVNDIAHPEDLDISPNFINRSLAGETDSIRFEKRYFHKDGRVIWGEVSSSIVRDHFGKPLYFISHVIDNTERKRAEETLRKSEGKYRALVETTDTGYLILDEAGRVLDANPEYVRLTGHKTLEEILGRSVVDWTATHDQERNAQEVKKCLERGFVRSLEIDYIDGNGKVIPIEINAKVIETEGGLRVISLCRDIAERKRAEEAVQRARQDWEDIFQAIGHPTLILDKEHNIIIANQAVARAAGGTEEDLIGKKCYEVFHGTEQPPHGCPLEKMVISGQLETVEMEMEALDGTFLVSCTPVFDEAGHLQKVIHIATDISERRKTEKELQESEERYRTLVETSPTAIVMGDIRGNLLFVNENLARMHGYENSKELLSRVKNIRELVASESQGVLEREFENVLKDGYSKMNEYILPKKDGTKFPASVTASLIRDSEGMPTGFVAVAMDITERKQVENVTRVQRDLGLAIAAATDLDTVLRLCVEAAIQGSGMDCGGVYLVDQATGGLVLKSHAGLSPEFIKIVSLYGPEAPNTKLVMAGEPIYSRYTELGVDLDDPQRIEGLQAIAVIPVKHEGKTIACLNVASHTLSEIPHISRNALESIASQIGGAIDRRKTVEALQNSERFLKNVFDGIQDGISVLDSDLNIVQVNQWIEKMYASELPFIGNKCYVVYQKRQSPCPFCPTIHTLETGEVHTEIVLYPNAEKPTGWIELSTFPLKDEKGETIGVIEHVKDITERKRAEEALHESEEKYRNLIDQSRDAIYLLFEEKFEIINKRFEELFGYTQDETNTPDFNFMNLVAPKSRDVIKERVLKVERDEPVSPQYEFTAISRDGKEIEVETSVSYIKYKGGIATQGILRDITERKQLQEQLLQSEKMSALGQLISGVAHELNNPMTSVLGFSQLLLMSENIPDKEKQSLEKINQEAERARKIVQNLLTFSRQRKPTKRTAQINEIVNRTLDLRAYEMRVSNIEIVRNLDPDIPLIFADDHQIQQVFMNLIINAEQAMLAAHQRGRLEVFTQCEKEKNVISISFRDDGPGIAKEHLSRIFDPFFTTKPVGKGTGLGLSIAYGIIEEHGGRITAVNNYDKGATFSVELPIQEVPIAKGTLPPPHAGDVRNVQKKIVLVVDDEVSVVELVRAALEREGYTVETAYDGNYALEKLKKSNFDAVVSDLKMPGKNGMEIYLYCKEHKPDLTKRFLFLTGDIVAPDSLRFMEEQRAPYVAKPFDLKGLVSSIEKLFNLNG